MAGGARPGPSPCGGLLAVGGANNAVAAAATAPVAWRSPEAEAAEGGGSIATLSQFVLFVLLK